jgi:hypothetical protein
MTSRLGMGKSVTVFYSVFQKEVYGKKMQTISISFLHGIKYYSTSIFLLPRRKISSSHLKISCFVDQFHDVFIILLL